MTQATPDSTSRFSKPVADYVRYRPSYPEELVQTLKAAAGLKPSTLLERKRLFDEHQSGGQVQFDYDTELFFGRLTPRLRRS